MNKINKKRGFSLIEVMLAVGILSIIMVAFSAYFNNAMHLSASSSDIDSSSSIAQSNIENNNGSEVHSQLVTFNFGDGIVIQEQGDVLNSSSGNVTYSVLVADGARYNDSGWGQGEIIGNPTPTPTATAPTEIYYHVTFLNDIDNGIISSQTIIKGGDASWPEVPEYDGYTYTGRQSVNITNVQSDMIVYYYYDEVIYHDVTINYYKGEYGCTAMYFGYCFGYGWDYDYDSRETLSILEDEYLTSSDLKTFNNYDFYTITNSNGSYGLDLPLEITNDRTIRAYYRKNTTATYDISFEYLDLYSVQQSESNSYNEGEDISLPSGVPNLTSNDSVFEDWSFGGDTYTSSQIDSMTATQDMSFTANYSNLSDTACSTNKRPLYKYYNNGGNYTDYQGNKFYYVYFYYRNDGEIAFRYVKTNGGTARIGSRYDSINDPDYINMYNNVSRYPVTCE